MAKLCRKATMALLTALIVVCAFFGFVTLTKNASAEDAATYEAETTVVDFTKFVTLNENGEYTIENGGSCKIEKGVELNQLVRMGIVYNQVHGEGKVYISILGAKDENQWAVAHNAYCTKVFTGDGYFMMAKNADSFNGSKFADAGFAQLSVDRKYVYETGVIEVFDTATNAKVGEKFVFNMYSTDGEGNLTKISGASYLNSDPEASGVAWNRSGADTVMYVTTENADVLNNPYFKIVPSRESYSAETTVRDISEFVTLDEKGEYTIENGGACRIEKGVGLNRMLRMGVVYNQISGDGKIYMSVLNTKDENQWAVAHNAYCTKVFTGDGYFMMAKNADSFNDSKFTDAGFGETLVVNQKYVFETGVVERFDAYDKKIGEEFIFRMYKETDSGLKLMTEKSYLNADESASGISWGRTGEDTVMFITTENASGLNNPYFKIVSAGAEYDADTEIVDISKVLQLNEKGEYTIPNGEALRIEKGVGLNQMLRMGIVYNQIHGDGKVYMQILSKPDENRYGTSYGAYATKVFSGDNFFIMGRNADGFGDTKFGDAGFAALSAGVKYVFETGVVERFDAVGNKIGEKFIFRMYTSDASGLTLLAEKSYLNSDPAASGVAWREAADTLMYIATEKVDGVLNDPYFTIVSSENTKIPTADELYYAPVKTVDAAELFSLNAEELYDAPSASMGRLQESIKLNEVFRTGFVFTDDAEDASKNNYFGLFVSSDYSVEEANATYLMRLRRNGELLFGFDFDRFGSLGETKVEGGFKTGVKYTIELGVTEGYVLESLQQKAGELFKASVYHYDGANKVEDASFEFLNYGQEISYGGVTRKISLGRSGCLQVYCDDETARLTAGVFERTYKVNLNVNGSLSDTFTIAYGEAYDFSGNQPQVEGFDFTGWYYLDGQERKSVPADGTWTYDVGNLSAGEYVIDLYAALESRGEALSAAINLRVDDTYGIFRWNAVENAEKYYVSFNGGEWMEADGLSADISELLKSNLSKGSVTLAVKATAEEYVESVATYTYTYDRVVAVGDIFDFSAFSGFPASGVIDFAGVYPDGRYTFNELKIGTAVEMSVTFGNGDKEKGNFFSFYNESEDGWGESGAGKHGYCYKIFGNGNVMLGYGADHFLWKTGTLAGGFETNRRYIIRFGTFRLLTDVNGVPTVTGARTFAEIFLIKDDLTRESKAIFFYDNLSASADYIDMQSGHGIFLYFDDVSMKVYGNKTDGFTTKATLVLSENNVRKIELVHGEEYDFSGYIVQSVGYETRISYKVGNDVRYIDAVGVWDKAYDELTLTVEYIPIGYSIEYVYSMGVNGENPAEYNVTDEIELKDLTLDEGYIFLGWYRDEAFTGEAITLLKGMGNVRLYAKILEGYVVTAEMNGETITTKVEKGASCTLPAAPDGYKADKWQRLVNGEWVDFAETAFTPTANEALRATISLLSYKVSYELDGGNNGENPAEYKVTDEISLAAASKQGYFFIGWYLDAAYENVIEKIAGQTGDLTLYAKFEKDEIPTNVTLTSGNQLVPVAEMPEGSTYKVTLYRGDDKTEVADISDDSYNFEVGSYLLVYEITLASGETVTRETKITVEEAAVLTVSGTYAGTYAEGEKLTLLSASAGNLTVVCKVYLNGEEVTVENGEITLRVGNYIVEYTVEGDDSQKASFEFTVTKKAETSETSGCGSAVGGLSVALLGIAAFASLRKKRK